MQKIIISIIVLALVVLGVLYWTGNLGGSNSSGGTGAELTAQTWEWVSAQYEDGRVVEPREAGKFVLTFNPDGSFGATTDCNLMGGNYAVDGGNITFSEIFQTLMYCEGSQETEFANILNNTATYHFTDSGELVLGLKFDSGTARFR